MSDVEFIYGPCGRHGEDPSGSCWACEQLRPLEDLRDLILCYFKREIERPGLSPSQKDVRMAKRGIYEEMRPVVSAMARIEMLATPPAMKVTK